MIMELKENKCTVIATWVFLILPAVIVTSPSLTALLEIILYSLFIITPELRKRFIASLTQPLVISSLMLCAIIILSSLWSDASWEVKSEHIRSWRKVLLLPIAISLMTNPQLKDRFLLIFVAATVLYASISWGLYFLESTSFKAPNALLRNHATQGIIFFVAIFTSISLLLHKKQNTLPYILFLIFSTITIFLNYSIISTSRSGYVIGVILVICLGLKFGGKKSLLVTPILLISLLSILYLSPTPQKQIITMWNEITNVNNSKNLTSGGARVTYIKNTIPIIIDSPFIGHGLKSISIEYTKQVNKMEGWQGKATRDPHNQYLLILAEQGILGLIIFFAFIASCFYQKTESLYKYIGISVLLGWMTTSLFNGHFSASVEGKFIFLWCGAMLAMPLSANKHYVLFGKKKENAIPDKPQHI